MTTYEAMLQLRERIRELEEENAALKTQVSSLVYERDELWDPHQ